MNEKRWSMDRQKAKIRRMNEENQKKKKKAEWTTRRMTKVKEE